MVIKITGKHLRLLKEITAFCGSFVITRLIWRGSAAVLETCRKSGISHKRACNCLSHASSIQSVDLEGTLGKDELGHYVCELSFTQDYFVGRGS